MICVSNDDLLAFVEGRLPPQRVSEVEAHLLVCDLCRPLIAEIARTDADPEVSLPANGPVGRYELLGPIGAGGMGVVYAARDPQLNRHVALKMLRASGAPEATGAQLRARILREAQAMARLSHPNILTVYDVGVTGEAVFVAMELVEGGPVSEWLRQRKRSWREILEVFLSAGRGLAAAHRAGIVHRDFKPENVLIGRDGRVRVTDFGLARFAEVPAALSHGSREASAGVPVSVDGALAGSPPYMAPEQLRGQAADARSDVFAFCVSLYESLYGEPPFAGRTVRELEESIMAGALRPAPHRSQVPAAIRRAVVQGLSAHPARRFASMEQLVLALERASRGRWRLRAAALAAAAAMALWFGVRVVSSPHPTLLVADVVNETGEKSLDGLSGMLITSLEQSRRFTVLTRSRVLDLLRQGGGQGAERVDEALGRELCRRAGLDALVLTSVRRFGSRYAIDVKVLDPTRDRYLVSAKEEGADQDALPAMIDRLSERVRAGLRDPVDEIRASAPVANLTTGNLQAYAHYFRGDELFSELLVPDSVREFRTAISLDPSFALAHYKLAYVGSAIGYESAGDELHRTLQLIDRLPEREHLLALALQHRFEGRTAEAIELYQQALQSDPTDKHTAFEVGDILLHVYGDRAGAARWFQKVLDLDPLYTRAFDHLAWAARDERRYDQLLSWGKLLAERRPNRFLGNLYVAQAQEAYGNIDDAERTLLDVQQRFPTEWEPTVSLAELHWRAGHFMRAEADLAPLLLPTRPLSDRRRALRALSQMEGRRGRLAQAVLRLDEITELSRRAGEPDEAARSIAEKAFWFAFVGNDPAQARAAFEASLREYRHPLAVLPFAYEVALTLGYQQKAWELASDMRGYRSLGEAEAYARWGEGQRDQAIRILQRRARLGNSAEQVLWSFQVARWALEQRRPDTAIDMVEWIQRSPPAPINYSPWPEHTGELDALYAPSFFLLGKALEMRGDAHLAVEAFSRFVELWRDADGEIPDLVEAHARLVALRQPRTLDSPSAP
jgi:eukaryotic-like serine/threonine-protein kinase